MDIQVVTVKEAIGSIWTNAHIDIGPVSGVYRGYSLEFHDDNNNTEYSPLICTEYEPNDVNPDFNLSFNEMLTSGYTFTGRAVFRGYFASDGDKFTPLSDVEYQEMVHSRKEGWL